MLHRKEICTSRITSPSPVSALRRFATKVPPKIPPTSRNVTCPATQSTPKTTAKSRVLCPPRNLQIEIKRLRSPAPAPGTKSDHHVRKCVRRHNQGSRSMNAAREHHQSTLTLTLTVRTSSATTLCDGKKTSRALLDQFPYKDFVLVLRARHKSLIWQVTDSDVTRLAHAFHLQLNGAKCPVRE